MDWNRLEQRLSILLSIVFIRLLNEHLLWPLSFAAEAD